MLFRSRVRCIIGAFINGVAFPLPAGSLDTFGVSREGLRASGCIYCALGRLFNLGRPSARVVLHAFALPLLPSSPSILTLLLYEFGSCVTSFLFVVVFGVLPYVVPRAISCRWSFSPAKTQTTCSTHERPAIHIPRSGEVHRIDYCRIPSPIVVVVVVKMQETNVTRIRTGFG